MTKEQINEMAEKALRDLKEWINRSAGQHMRAIREKWSKS